MNRAVSATLVKISHAYNAILLCSASFQELSPNAADQNEALFMQFGMFFNTDSGYVDCKCLKRAFMMYLVSRLSIIN